MEPHAHSFNLFFFLPSRARKPTHEADSAWKLLTLHELAVLVCLCVQRIWCLPHPCQLPRSDVSITTPFSLLQMYFLNAYHVKMKSGNKPKLSQAFPTAKISHSSFPQWGNVLLKGVINTPEPST